MRWIVVALAIMISAQSAAMAQTSYQDQADGDEGVPLPGRFALRGGEVPFGSGEGLNAFFYPNGYDPQYGSDGRVADAADFAADYGCRPIWNAKYGRYIDACN